MVCANKLISVTGILIMAAIMYIVYMTLFVNMYFPT